MTDQELIKYLTDNGFHEARAEMLVETNAVTDKASADDHIANYAF
tara:strand:+ start:1823 stop:1957 length:135 start_codon:yes stop_codon:yes gene_type:complete